MHLFLAAEDSESHLLDELHRRFPNAELEPLPGALLVAKGLPPASQPLGPVTFARQFLPEARFVALHSIRDWAQFLLDSILGSLPEQQPWRLHILPRYGHGTAGLHRCELIATTLHEFLHRRRRQLRRDLDPGTSPCDPRTSVVQLILVDPDQAFFSLAPAPLPHLHRHTLSPFPAGDLPVASDKAAPSRAFAKLVEAELRLGQAIAPGQSCVDLGASPGSWSYVALQRGATVHAVDRAPLREDLMRHPKLVFHQGDAFQFSPESPVDWLLCDVIAAPERSIDLVLDWATRRLCRHFVVSIKFKGHGDYPLLDRLHAALPPLCSEFRITRLCANKNEACVMGTTLSP